MQPGNSVTAETPDDQQEANNGRWIYTETGSDDVVSSDILSPINWSASEYIDHEKRAGWFIGVGGVGLALAAIIYLVTRDVVSSGAIIVVGVLFGVFGARRPRTLEYSLDNGGIRIGSKIYGYDDFKSFAIMEEGAINSIQLLQLNRFATPITLYFPPEQEQEIINFLGSYLPHEIRSHSPIDHLMRKVRF